MVYVLSFLSRGGGPTEAGKVLGMLGLPNDTTMEAKSFTAIEERINKYIVELTDEILFENIEAEVTATVPEDATVQEWKASFDGNCPDSKECPKVDVSYDMGWQQKGSGHRHNSPSGHGKAL